MSIAGAWANQKRNRACGFRIVLSAKLQDAAFYLKLSSYRTSTIDNIALQIVCAMRMWFFTNTSLTQDQSCILTAAPMKEGEIKVT